MIYRSMLSFIIHCTAALHIGGDGGVFVTLYFRVLVPIRMDTGTVSPTILSSGTEPSVVLVAVSLAASTSGVTVIIIVTVAVIINAVIVITSTL